MLIIEKGTVGFADNLLFSHERLVVAQDKIIALFGPNGKGKTTFLKQIVRDLEQNLGKVEITGSYAYVPQLAANINSASGGEKTKFALTKAFNQRPNLLILDEPSANLDEIQNKWLIRNLKKFSGTILLVSHDLNLLNLANEIWAIEQGKLQTFNGNYTQYFASQKRKNEAQDAAYYQQQKEIGRLQNQVTKRNQQAYRIKAGRNKKMSISDLKTGRTIHDHMEKKMQKSAKALKHRIERIDRVEHVVTSKPIKFVDPNQDQYLRQTVLHLQKQDIYIDKRLLIKEATFSLKYGERLWLRGANGTGKTTLVKTILQNPNKFIPKEIGVGYFNQELQNVNLEQTVWENVSQNSNQTTQTIHAVLAGLDLKQIKQQASQLSGGQLVRLQLAKVLLGNNQLLILDEPTNYLDLETKAALEQFLQDYPGALLLISHDNNFTEKLKAHDLIISNKQLVATVTLKKHASADQGQLLKLKLEYDRLVSDSNAKMSEIKEVKEKIDHLKSSNKH